jgi:hypothetical protein
MTIPGGTRLALVLTQRVNSKTMHPGDTIYAQTTAPVSIGDQLAIPSGTFVRDRQAEASWQPWRVFLTIGIAGFFKRPRRHDFRRHHTRE